MRIFLLLQDDPFFLPDTLGTLLDRHNVVGATVLGQKLPHDHWLSYCARYVNVFGFWGLLRLSVWGLWRKYVLGKNLGKHLKARGIPLLTTKNINSVEFCDTLRNIQPDLLVSIACPQKLHADLLGLPLKGAINLHGGYLPDFPGVFTPFWNLLKGADQAGCTVHWMNNHIDGGEIIGRAAFPIHSGMSIYSIYEEISRLGIPLLAEALKDIERGAVVALPNPHAANAYHSFPTRRDRLEFVAKGLRVI